VGTVCFGMECGNCVLDWSEGIVSVGIVCGNCVCWNGLWRVCVLERFKS
jgi:hypothetical protein